MKNKTFYDKLIKKLFIRRDSMYSKLKRIIDCICSFIGIIILLPIFLIISILILLLDGKPILFKQERIGKKGKKFIIYKFRTMIVKE